MKQAMYSGKEEFGGKVIALGEEGWGRGYRLHCPNYPLHVLEGPLLKPPQ